ncbi:hypothetical protein CR513_50473, partial [Mucuna pruriens]
MGELEGSPHGGIHIVINRATLDRCSHTNTNAPDPIRIHTQPCLVQLKTLNFSPVFCQFLCFSHGGKHIVTKCVTLKRNDHTSTNALDLIIFLQSSVLRIPSELRIHACLGESSTRMGDLLGNPRVAPCFLPIVVSIEDTTFSHVFHRFSCFSNGSIYIVTNHATLEKCDHTSTNALDPIKTLQ